MKHIFIGLALLVSVSAGAGDKKEIELVRNAEIVEVQTWVEHGTETFSVTLKGGTGLCANRKLIIGLEKTHSRLIWSNNYNTALAAFTMQLKTVSLGSAFGKKDCDQITYIKLTRPSA